MLNKTYAILIIAKVLFACLIILQAELLPAAGLLSVATKTIYQPDQPNYKIEDQGKTASEGQRSEGQSWLSQHTDKSIKTADESRRRKHNDSQVKLTALILHDISDKSGNLYLYITPIVVSWSTKRVFLPVWCVYLSP